MAHYYDDVCWECHANDKDPHEPWCSHTVGSERWKQRQAELARLNTVKGWLKAQTDNAEHKEDDTNAVLAILAEAWLRRPH